MWLAHMCCVIMACILLEDKLTPYGLLLIDVDHLDRVLIFTRISNDVLHYFTDRPRYVTSIIAFRGTASRSLRQENCFRSRAPLFLGYEDR